MPELIPVQKSTPNANESEPTLVPVSKSSSEPKLTPVSSGENDSLSLYKSLQEKNKPATDKPFYETAKETTADNYTLKGAMKVKESNVNSFAKISKVKASKDAFEKDLFTYADQIPFDDIIKEKKALQGVAEEKQRQQSLKANQEIPFSERAQREGKDVSIGSTYFESDSEKQARLASNKSKEFVDLGKEIAILEKAKAQNMMFKQRAEIETKFPNKDIYEKHEEFLKKYYPEQYAKYTTSNDPLNKEIASLEKKLNDYDKENVRKGKGFDYTAETLEEQIRDLKIISQKKSQEFSVNAINSNLEYLSMSSTKMETPELKDKLSELRNVSNQLKPIDSQLLKLKRDIELARSVNNVEKYNKLVGEYNKTYSSNKSLIEKHSELVSSPELSKYNEIQQAANAAHENSKKELENMQYYYPELASHNKVQQDKALTLDKAFKESPAYKFWYATGSAIFKNANELSLGISTIPSTVTNLFGDSYGVTDKWADLATLHNEKLASGIVSGTPSPMALSLVHDFDMLKDKNKDYKVIVDADGKAQTVRDKQGYKISPELESELIGRYNNLNEDQKNIKKDYDLKMGGVKAVNSVMYQVAQMYSFGALGNGFSKGAKLASMMKMGETTADVTGMIAANLVIAHKGYYDQAMSNPNMGKKEAAWFALMASGVEGFLERINPMELNAFRGGEASKAFSNVFASKLAEGLTKQEAFSYALSGLGKNMKKEVFEEVLQNYAVGVTGEAFNFVLNNDKLNAMPSVNETIETIIVTALSTAPMGISQAVREGRVSSIDRDAMYAVTEKGNEVKYNMRLSKMLSEGKITQEQFSLAKSRIENIKTANSKLPVDMESSERYSLLPIMNRKVELENEIKSLDPALRVRKKAELARVDAMLVNKVASIDKKKEEESLAEQQLATDTDISPTTTDEVTLNKPEVDVKVESEVSTEEEKPKSSPEVKRVIPRVKARRIEKQSESEIESKQAEIMTAQEQEVVAESSVKSNKKYREAVTKGEIKELPDYSKKSIESLPEEIKQEVKADIEEKNDITLKNYREHIAIRDSKIQAVADVVKATPITEVKETGQEGLIDNMDSLVDSVKSKLKKSELPELLSNHYAGKSIKAMKADPVFMIKSQGHLENIISKYNSANGTTFDVSKAADVRSVLEATYTDRVIAREIEKTQSLYDMNKWAENVSKEKSNKVDAKRFNVNVLLPLNSIIRKFVSQGITSLKQIALEIKEDTGIDISTMPEFFSMSNLYLSSGGLRVKGLYIDISYESKAKAKVSSKLNPENKKGVEVASNLKTKKAKLNKDKVGKSFSEKLALEIAFVKDITGLDVSELIGANIKAYEKVEGKLVERVFESPKSMDKLMSDKMLFNKNGTLFTGNAILASIQSKISNNEEALPQQLDNIITGGNEWGDNPSITDKVEPSEMIDNASDLESEGEEMKKACNHIPKGGIANIESGEALRKKLMDNGIEERDDNVF
jgi:hypothetical protein